MLLTSYHERSRIESGGAHLTLSSFCVSLSLNEYVLSWRLTSLSLFVLKVYWLLLWSLYVHSLKKSLPFDIM